MSPLVYFIRWNFIWDCGWWNICIRCADGAVRRVEHYRLPVCSHVMDYGRRMCHNYESHDAKRCSTAVWRVHFSNLLVWGHVRSPCCVTQMKTGKKELQPSKRLNVPRSIHVPESAGGWDPVTGRQSLITYADARLDLTTSGIQARQQLWTWPLV